MYPLLLLWFCYLTNKNICGFVLPFVKVGFDSVAAVVGGSLISNSQPVMRMKDDLPDFVPSFPYLR